MQNEREIKNILVIDLGQMGDVVLSLPALAALRQRFDRARLTVMTGKVPGQVVDLSNLADEVIAIDRVDLRDGPKLRSIYRVFKIVSDVRRRRFDLVIDLHSLPETNLLAFLSGAGSRLLGNRESRSIDRFSNFRPKPLPEDKSKHLTQRYFDVLWPLGVEPASALYRFPVTGGDRELMRQILPAEAAAKYIGLFPGAGHPSRCWPLSRFAELAERLEVSGLTPVVFLGPEEADMRDEVEQAFGADVRIVEGLSIKQFIACSSQLEAFVTNDTGPVHLAACAGAPIVLLLDHRAPLTYLPLAERLEIVQEGTIDALPVQTVLSAVISLTNDKTHAAC